MHGGDVRATGTRAPIRYIFLAMKNRLLGALRDLWWLLLIFLAGTAGVGVFIGAVFAIIVALAIIGTFGYFAWVRYDDTGQERSDIG